MNMKLNDQDFRTVVTEAYEQFLEAGDTWLRINSVLGIETNARDKRIVAEAKERAHATRTRVLYVLGLLTDLAPVGDLDAEISKLLEDAMKRAKRGTVDVQGA